MSARDVQQALRRLVGTEAGYVPLDDSPQVGARPGAVSVGHPGGGGGFGVEFAEMDYLLREYWAPRMIASTDGIFAWQEEPIRSLTLESGGKATFAQPPE